MRRRGVAGARRLARRRSGGTSPAGARLIRPRPPAGHRTGPGAFTGGSGARHGTRLGNWLTKEQANDLLNAPNPKTLAGKRDRAILALLIGCGLRRAELLRLECKDLQHREARWVLPDLVGKGNRVRTVTVPAGVKARIDGWTAAAGITEGRLFRPVTKASVGDCYLVEDDHQGQNWPRRFRKRRYYVPLSGFKRALRGRRAAEVILDFKLSGW